MKGLASTPRTISAIKKADALATVIPGGKMQNGNVQQEPGGSSYTLFEVVKASDTSVIINGYNTSAGRYSRNLCIFGLSSVELADAASVTGITVTGVIYLEVTYSSGYTVTPKFAASLPAQDTTHIYWYLADVVCVDSKISAIYQPPISQINIPARAG